jgi:hypothetical protein
MSAVPADADSYRYLIDFVRPTASQEERLDRQTSQEPRVPTLSGADAKAFYEELVLKDETASKEKPGQQRTRTLSSQRSKSKPTTPTQKLKTSHVDCKTRSGGSLGTASNCDKKTAAKGGSTHAKEIKTLSVHQAEGIEGSSNKVSQRLKDHRQSELFRLAQNGEGDGVKALLGQGVDVNCVDGFGWTASMSAAFEGHVHVLQLLVVAGADLMITNSQGQTALSLASLKQRQNVIDFIKNLQEGGERCAELQKEKKSVEKFYCSVCKHEFSDIDQVTHNRSTVHIFNTGAKPKADSFLIPPSNVGYRLMLKSGWDGDGGLGPSGHGQKFPVRTFLKRDRQGLGNKVTDKAKVTHFHARDKAAVTSVCQINKRIENARTISRREQRRKERKERQKEIDLRRQLS